MLRTILAVLAAATGITGCATSHTLQSARPLGKGKLQMTLELGAQSSPLERAPLAPDPKSLRATGDFSLRFGLSPHTDCWLRGGGSGLETGLKYSLWTSSRFGVALLSGLRGRAEIFEKESSRRLMEVLGGMILEYRPNERVALVLAPRLIGSTPFPGDRFSVGGERPGPGWGYGGTAGVEFAVGEQIVLMPEIAAYPRFPPRANFDDRAHVTFAVGIGFRDAL